MGISKDRIVFLDVLRAFAVIMMLQGHTVHTFLGEEYRTAESTVFSVWESLRAYTAPVFMFTAGVVFTFLLRSNPLQLGNNPRVKKGIIRFAQLIAIGYLLRYPTYKLVVFSGVTQNQWEIFFAVDALHLIGFGLLFIIITAYLSEKSKIKFNLLLILGTVFFFGLYPLSYSINWSSIFPAPVAAYFFKDSGSIFPFFPYAGYILGGGILGNYLVNNSKIYKEKKFVFNLLGLSALLMVVGSIISGFENSISIELWKGSIGKVILISGVVTLLSAVLASITRKTDKVPKIISKFGKNSLLIYVTHLVILYGCAWFPGLIKFYGKSLSPAATVSAVIGMFLLITGMIFLIDHYKKDRKNLTPETQTT